MLFKCVNGILVVEYFNVWLGWFYFVLIVCLLECWVIVCIVCIFIICVVELCLMLFLYDKLRYWCVV